jgi:hypothetical protein
MMTMSASRVHRLHFTSNASFVLDLHHNASSFMSRKLNDNAQDSTVIATTWTKP